MAFERGASAVGDDRHGMLVGQLQRILHVLRAFGKDHGRRRGGPGGAPLAARRFAARPNRGGAGGGTPGPGGSGKGSGGGRGESLGGGGLLKKKKKKKK